MEYSEDNLPKKPIKEVPVVQDQGFFQYSTGDTYDGYFEAKKSNMSVKMHGPGIYTTAEGDIYAGIWENDKFGAGNDDVMIAYADGSKYEGSIKDWCYNGQGKYTYPDGTELSCNFSENCPVGNLTLKDPNGHTWLGHAELGFGWCSSVNHYYSILESVREVPKIKRRHRTVSKLENPVQ